jgi:hypothetical protein
MIITNFPIINEQHDYSDLCYRIFWYFSPCEEDIDKIYIICKKKFSLDLIPTHFDSQIEINRKKFENKIEIIIYQNENKLKDILENTDIFLLTDMDILNKTGIYRTVQILIKKHKAKIINFDKYDVEGSKNLPEILTAPDLSSVYSQRFKQLKSEIGSVKNSFVYGTGPSLNTKIQYTHTQNLHIACNSMIANIDLMNKLKPQIIVAADPVFHFGCSQYAGIFRQKLTEAMDKYGSWFITVGHARLNLFSKNLPEKYAKKCIALQPDNTSHNIIYKFDESLTVTITSNILTLLMLPIAAFFSDHINIVGCEGRTLQENNTYWQYDRQSQLNDELESIKKVHPGFFKIDFNEYYLIHCNTVHRWIKKLESDGKSIQALTDSYIPALKDRFVADEKSTFDNRDIVKAMRIRKFIPGWNRFHTEPLVRIGPRNKNHHRAVDLIRIYTSIFRNAPFARAIYRILNFFRKKFQASRFARIKQLN